LDIDLRTLIGIGYLKPADTNNYIWYGLEIADTKIPPFSYRINGIAWQADTKDILPIDTINIFCSRKSS
jgi:hypothetical protein